MLGSYLRTNASPDALDEVIQSGRPRPVRCGFLETLPGSGSILPHFVTVRIPIITEHLYGSSRAINFQCGTAVLLQGESAGDNAESAVAKVEQDLCVVLRLHTDSSSSDLAFRYGHAGHGHNAARRSEQSGKTGETINAEIEQAATSRFVKPFAPIRPGPAVPGTGGTWFAYVSPADAPCHRLKCRAESCERGADQMTCALLRAFDQGSGISERGGEWFFKQDMFACPQRGTGQTGVPRHRSKNDDEIHIRGRNDFLRVCCETGVAQCGAGRVVLPRAAAGHRCVHPPARPQPLDRRLIGAQDVAATYDAEANRRGGSGYGNHGTMHGSMSASETVGCCGCNIKEYPCRMSVKKTLQSRLADMRPSEAEVTRQLLRDLGVVAEKSLRDVAAGLKTSDATVVRACRAGGFDGFQDLKYHVLRELTSGGQMRPAVNGEHHYQSDILASVDAADSSLGAAAGLLVDSSRVALVGVGASLGVALILTDVLFTMGKQALPIHDAQMAGFAFTAPVKGLVLIAISHSGETQFPLSIILEAKNSGVKSIGLCNEPGSEMGRAVDVLLPTQTVERPAGSFAIAPRICQLAVLDQLLTRVRGLEQKQGERTKR